MTELTNKIDIKFIPFSQPYIMDMWLRKYNEDKLLEEIKMKKQRKQTILPSLFQLCVLSVSTKDLPKYNELNRTLLLDIR